MSTHETIARDHNVQPGSDRGFGLLVGGLLGAVGAYQYVTDAPLYPWFLVPGMVLIGLGLIAPLVLHPLNVAWMRLGVLLGTVVTPVVMLLVFAISIVPIGLALRAAGKDPLRLKRRPDAASYWLPRDPPGPEPETLKDQF